MNKILFSLLLILSIISCKKNSLSNHEILQIHAGWKFKQADSGSWYPAEVPGCVHTDLLANGIIDDPFYRTNEHNLQWIDKHDWEYTTRFDVPENILKKEKIILHFRGLDTYASVKLNDSLIITSNNMFREWSADVKNLIKPADNILHITFHSPILAGLQQYDSLDYEIPVSSNDQSELGGTGDKKVSIFTRKAGYHFGWDWGPRLVTSGIWKPIELHAWDDAIIEDVWIQQKSLDVTQANVNVVTTIQSTKDFSGTLILLVNKKEKSKTPINLKPGKNEIMLSTTIENPELWWPNGMGNHPLYEFSVTIQKEDIILDSKNTRSGLRTMELVREGDSLSKSFYFKVNGKPVFMKGANYIPQDIFLNRVSEEQYRHIIGSAVNTNMNMLRVWGGGIYENDIFYQLCDENGILVWQDFMFACAMFPGDSSFLENVKKEAEENVTRLRNHPSIALWCGNNEILAAWFQWGWKKKIEEKSLETANIIWKAYEDIFHKILPQTVKTMDPGRQYWASSPQSDEGVPESLTSGDVHYWMVWWGQQPFNTYKKAIGRFMSEYGFQSFPEISTIKKFSIPEDWDIFSEVMKAHQRSSIGNGTIKHYMNQHYKEPMDFENFLYVGQLLQAEGVKTAIHAHRINMPYCMGSLYWQIDDCWPVASWSSIDYYGNWKALQFFARNAFKPILISPEFRNDSIIIHLVSDLQEKIEGDISLSLLTFSGKKIWHKEAKTDLPPVKSIEYLAIPLKTLSEGIDRDSIVLVCNLTGPSGLTSSENLFFTEPKDLKLSPVNITKTIQKEKNITTISLSSDKLAKNVYIQSKKPLTFSDNFFDLLPGEEFHIQIATNLSTEELESILSISSLVDTYK